MHEPGSLFNQVREFLGGRGSSKIMNLVRLTPNQVQSSTEPDSP
jgi:hypothetical protein